jgi:hypothetical protein
MRKLTFEITEEGKTFKMEAISDRSPEWHIDQYLRHRRLSEMKLISNEETEETEAISREV